MKVRVANSRFLNGLGVFTTKDLNKCEVIAKLEYVREVTKEQPLAENEKYEHQTYLPDGRIFLVAEPMRYTNHSCSPNSYLYSVEEQYFIIAKHQIAEGTEITIDYELNAVDGDTWECLCRSDKCRGLHKWDFFSLPVSVILENLPYLDPWFEKEHQKRIRRILEKNLNSETAE